MNRPEQEIYMIWENISEDVMEGSLEMNTVQMKFMWYRRIMTVLSSPHRPIWPVYTKQLIQKNGIRKVFGLRFQCTLCPVNWIIFYDQSTATDVHDSQNYIIGISKILQKRLLCIKNMGTSLDIGLKTVAKMFIMLKICSQFTKHISI